MKNKQAFLFILVLVISLATGFYGGMVYQKRQTRSRLDQFNIQRGQFPFGQNSRFNTSTRPVNGEIIRKDNDSLTIKLRDGSTKIILLTSKTDISKSARAKVEDLKESQTVFIIGQENSDGSIIAETIQIR